MAAKDYKVFDGAAWVSPCDQEIRLLKPDGTWQLIDPNADDVKYFDGVNWKPMECEAVIDCTQGSLSGSGGPGIYYIPMVVPANVCNVSVTFDIYSICDALQIISQDKTTILAQTGFYGAVDIPTVGSYNFGPAETNKIYNYQVGGGFAQNLTAPAETLNITANEYPLVNTNPLNIPLGINPGNTSETIRTIVWTKGVTANPVNILIRVVGVTPNTGWQITALTCVACP